MHAQCERESGASHSPTRQAASTRRHTHAELPSQKARSRQTDRQTARQVGRQAGGHGGCEKRSSYGKGRGHARAHTVSLTQASPMYVGHASAHTHPFIHSSMKLDAMPVPPPHTGGQGRHGWVQRASGMAASARPPPHLSLNPSVGESVSQ